MNHHARHKVPKAEPISFGRIMALIVVAALGMAALLAWRQHLYRASIPDWPSAVGQVVGNRIVVVGTQERSYQPDAILYQAEVDVKYTRDGVQTTRWFPVYRVDSSRADVALWLESKKSKQCMIRWNPRNPEDVVVTLH